ncbi:MAG: VCBS repeat-containing protein, partial [Ignavibacteriales bacterium]|nr:VCBS repeat-containing protein [Ignavibacteriales bacterium]
MSTLKYFLTISFFIAVFFLQFSSPLYAQGFSEVFSGQLDSLYGGSVAWGDYDNDGKLDILMTGVNENGFPRTNIYRNTGSGFTKVFANVLPGVATSSATWGDYDNDGDLDILITGQDTTGNISRIYQNTGSGFSEVFSGTLIGVAFSSAAWGDYDNDGKLDILITGHSNPIGEPFPLPVPVSKIYRNTGNGFTEVYAWTIKGVRESAAAWGDYDNDGKLDFILSGLDTTDVAITKLYRNTGSGFTEVYAGSFTGVRTGSLAWGDYDSDGRLDILLTGDSSNFNGVSKIYRNTGSEFTEVY